MLVTMNIYHIPVHTIVNFFDICKKAAHLNLYYGVCVNSGPHYESVQLYELPLAKFKSYEDNNPNFSG